MPFGTNQQNPSCQKEPSRMMRDWLIAPYFQESCQVEETMSKESSMTTQEPSVAKKVRSEESKIAELGSTVDQPVKTPPADIEDDGAVRLGDHSPYL
jgi:hypothetical protein